MALDYGWEKLYSAVLGVASSTASLQERLGDAYLSSVTHIRAENVPENVWPRVEAFRKKLTSAKVSHNIVNATVRQMSDMDATELVGELVGMYDNVARAFGKQRQF